MIKNVVQSKCRPHKIITQREIVLEIALLYQLIWVIGEKWVAYTGAEF